jgi:hypothetical protein
MRALSALGKKMANTMSINHEFQDIFKSAQQIEAKFVVFQQYPE